MSTYVSIPDNFEEDHVMTDLFSKIEYSSDNFFITGKAGTGKTTLLQYLARNTSKNSAIVAFTGIAALNAGGETIHSFFRFPIKPMLPNDPDILRFKTSHQKYTVIRELELLIIDESSMVRSDLFAAIDYSLRINSNRRDEPFGGRQVVMFGDLFQLSPIVNEKDEVEKHIIYQNYGSPYFFTTPSYRQGNFKLMELTKIYRQTEPMFIDLLNKIRTGSVSSSDLEKLNVKTDRARYYEDDYSIILVTTNLMSGEINRLMLEKLNSPIFEYTAKITDYFPQELFPTDLYLKLKKGAQVVFIRNDNLESRWVNGTLGLVKELFEDHIEVMLADKTVVRVDKEIWENTAYAWDEEQNKITTTTIGTFKQFPLKLAWAMTIHKSQGLTLDRVTIDLGRGAFTHGQTYVALSRCRSFETLILKREVRAKDIIIDKKVIEFYKSING